MSLDWGSGWWTAKDGAKGLIDTLRKTFSTFGIPDELASDGGPADWGGVYITAVPFNCRAEVGVKSMKRLVTGNIQEDGSLDIDKFQRAVLILLNSPDRTRQATTRSNG